MRYHWGLGVGHLHAHQPTSTSNCIPDEPKDTQDDWFPDIGLGESSNAHALDSYPDNVSEVESDNPELGLDDREQDVETGSEDASDIDSEHESEGMEEEFVGM